MAVSIVEVLASQGVQVSPAAIAKGLSNVRWPCRLEVLARQPLVICDGAHNVYSMETMLSTLRESFDFGRLLAVVGFSRDKSVSEMVAALAQSADVAIATRSRHPRSLAPAELGQVLHRAGVDTFQVAENVADALALARQQAGPDDLILATGSLFVAAEAREQVLGIEPELYPDLLPPDLR